MSHALNRCPYGLWTANLQCFCKNKPEYGRSLRTRAQNPFVLSPKDDKNFISRSTYVALKFHRAELFIKFALSALDTLNILLTSYSLC